MTLFEFFLSFLCFACRAVLDLIYLHYSILEAISHRSGGFFLYHRVIVYDAQLSLVEYFPREEAVIIYHRGRGE